MNKAANIQKRFHEFLRKSPTPDTDLERLISIDDWSQDNLMMMAVDLGRRLDEAYERLKEVPTEIVCAHALRDIAEVMEGDRDLEKIDKIMEQVHTKLVMFDAVEKMLEQLKDAFND